MVMPIYVLSFFQPNLATENRQNNIASFWWIPCRNVKTWLGFTICTACSQSYCTVLYFCGSLISIFNCLQSFFNKKFWHMNHRFHALTARVLMENISELCCQIHKEHSWEISWQRKLELTTVWQCMLGRTIGLYAMPIVHMYVASMWFRQQICKIISIKSSKTAICQNLDPRIFISTVDRENFAVKIISRLRPTTKI